jgi:uncharacterized alkaline shock family protein YloU
MNLPDALHRRVKMFVPDGRNVRLKKETVMEEEKKVTLTIQDEEGSGFIRIADDVVSNIAGLAVTEVDGVSRLTGNIPNELISKLGKKNLSKGIRVTYQNRTFTVDVSVVVKFGFNIVEVSKSVQEKVKQALLTMTGLSVSKVNVRVSGIDFSDR